MKSSALSFLPMVLSLSRAEWIEQLEYLLIGSFLFVVRIELILIIRRWFEYQVWMSVAAMELAILKHPEPVNTCCFSSDGNFIATGCTDSAIRIWSASTFSCTVELQDLSSRVLFVSFLSGNEGNKDSLRI